MDKRPTFVRPLMMGAVVLVTAAIALSAVLTHAQQSRESATTLEALAAKVKQLQDIQEISAVLVEYGRALDSRDFKAYSNLFAKDGSWSGGMGSVSGGPQAIYDFMTSRIGGARQNNPAGAGGARQPADNPAAPNRQGGDGGRQGGGSYHIMSNFRIEVNGDTATASSRWTFVTAARGPGINLAGTYEDTLVRENGQWKFKKRQAFNDITAPSPGSQPAAGSGATPPARFQ
jgi:hypothetical protein